MDIRKGTEVCFLFGSAISLPDSGMGMPSVDEMVDIIIDYLTKYGDDGLEAHLRNIEHAATVTAVVALGIANLSKQLSREGMHKK